MVLYARVMPQMTTITALLPRSMTKDFKLDATDMPETHPASKAVPNQPVTNNGSALRAYSDAAIVGSTNAQTGTARMSERETDQMLVERVQQGDKKAFDLLVLKYQHKIISLISRYVSDYAESLDVAQEAFIKAYRAIKRFRGDSAFYTWMYRIAINTAKNHLVAQSRRPPASDLDAQEAEQFGGDSRLKDSGSPEHELLKQEIEKTIDDAISSLPSDLRTAITLREMDGMSYEDIAVTMGCPIGTVRSRIFRAREAIDQRLQPLLQDEN